MNMRKGIVTLAGVFVSTAFLLGSMAPAASAARYNSSLSDLRISSMTDSADPVVYRKDLTYTITVSNGGPAYAVDAHLFDYGVSKDELVSFQTTRGSCSYDWYGLDCSLGDLAKGSSARVTIHMRPTGTGLRENTAWVRTDSENKAGTDTTTITTLVLPGPNGELASCSETAEATSRSFPSCYTAFATDQTTTQRLQLKPGPDFTGELRAYVGPACRVGCPSQLEVFGTFVNGQLVAGLAESTVSRPAGRYGMHVWAESARVWPECSWPDPELNSYLPCRPGADAAGGQGTLGALVTRVSG